MISKKEIQILLNEDMNLECYYAIIEQFVRYFAMLNNINITENEFINKDILDKIYRYLLWKMIENYYSQKEEIFRLKELRYDVLCEKDKNKQLKLYGEYLEIYEKITKNEIKKEKINIAKELKNLTREEEYEMAVNILEQIYYANKFRKILDKYNIKYEWYLNCEELSYKIQYNIEDLKPYVVDIGYNVDENLKYKLERLIDNAKYIEEIL